MIQHQNEYNDLLDALLPFGQQMLNKHGEFYPYSAIVDRAGIVVLLANQIEEKHPNASEVLDSLLRVIREQVKKEDCRAAGVCVNVSIIDPRTNRKCEALQFIFEHSEGESLDIYFPFQKRLFRGVNFEKPFSQASEPKIFNS